MFRISLVFIQIWIIFKFGSAEELTIVTDIDRNRSFVVTKNSDRGVYCIANGEPIQLEDSCISIYSRIDLNKSVKPNEHVWSSLSIFNSSYEHKGNLTSEYIFLSVYSIDTNEIAIKLNEVELKFTKKNQCKGWNDLTIQCTNNTLNFNSDCFEKRSLNNCLNQYITNIKVKSVGQNETIYWKLGLDNLRKLNKTTTKIVDIMKDKKTHKDYVKTYAYNGTVMLKINNTEMKRINGSNWYYLNLTIHNINKSTLEGSSSNGAQIGSVYLCKFMERVYKFNFERGKNYSCGFQNDSQKMIIIKKSENYTYKDLNKIANDTRLFGTYVCTKSKCFCKSGYEGDYCDKACTQSWGDNCAQKCGFCSNNKTCHRFTGKCEECVPGFFTDYCTEKFEFNYTTYSKNQTHMWIRWNTNRKNSDVSFKIAGKSFENSEQCKLWTKYSNYRCSILNFQNNTIFEVLYKYGSKNWTVFNLTNIEYDTLKASEAPLNLSSDSNKIFWNHPDITNGPLTYFLINVTALNISDQCQINKTITKEQKIYEINYKYNTTITKCYEENNIIYLHSERNYNITVTPCNTIKGKSSEITVSSESAESFFPIFSLNRLNWLRLITSLLFLIDLIICIVFFVVIILKHDCRKNTNTSDDEHIYETIEL